MEEENKKVTRRKFLEDSSKKALAGSAAAFLGFGMVKTKDVQAAAGCVFCLTGCSGTCKFSCYSWCSSSCTNYCANTCSYCCTSSCSSTCTGNCLTGCTSACTQDCELGCNDSGRSVSAAEAACGSCVSEREASTRHVTV